MQPLRSSVRFPLLAVISSIAVYTSCATVSYLEEDEQIYTKPTVSITADSPVRRRGALESDLEDTLRPIPNTAWFGLIRPWLWVHYAVGEPEEPGIRSWIYDRFAEQPVLFAEVSPDRSAASMQTWLFNRGHFDNEIDYSILEDGHWASVDYTVSLSEPYRFMRPKWPQDDDDLHRALSDLRDDSLIIPGDIYQLEVLREERVRIDQILKNRGFYAFAPDYLMFEAERDVENRFVDLQLVVSPDSPESVLIPYTIGSISIYADHSPGSPPSADNATVIELDDDYRYIERRSRFRPEVIAGAILFRPGDLYSRERHIKTVNRLMSLGVFRFVNIRYEQDSDSGTLHASVLLSPSREKTIEGELLAVTRSNGFAGPGLSGRYRDRNTFGGAELFTIDLNASFETLIGTDRFEMDSYDIGLETSLSFPRIIAPSGYWADGRGPTMPRTTIRAGYSTLTRIDSYRLDQFTGSLGYEWSRQPLIRHDLRPVEITFVRPLDFSSGFQEVIDANPALARSFDEQFIIGGSYRFIYSRRNEEAGNRQTYFNSRLDFAGNLLALTQAALSDRDLDPDDPFTILEIPYSQFIRIDTDSRYHVPLGDHHLLAGRIAAGAGYPLGNSASLPRVKQFSVGGTNSVRAFQGRTIGPGILPPESDGGPAIERSSDLRLEASLEYRFRIVGFVKGALFADAGNIWSLDPDATGQTGRFDASRILEQAAIGTGVGLRIDPQFVVFRLDVATPLRKPWLAPGERWVANQIDVLNRQWRRENLVFNIAIGYPF